MSSPSQRPYRKFDSAIQKGRGPIKDPAKFNELLQDFAQHIGTFLKDLRQKHEMNDAAAERALEIANQLTEMEPQRGATWSCKCKALFYLRRLDEAVEANLRALEIDPSDPEKWQLQGKMLDGLDRHQEAVAAFQRARELT